MTDTSWIVEGARVAEYDNRGYNARAEFAMIERLTATQIVLDNGRRYNRDRLRPVGDPYGKSLLPANAREVQNAVAARQVSAVSYAVHNLTGGNAGRSVETALAILDQIEQAVDDARRAIAAAGEG